MIKQYTELTEYEKILVYDFVFRDKYKEKNLKELDNMFNKEIYNYGKGVLFYFSNGIVVATAKIVLEVVKVLKNVFIHNLDIIEVDNTVEILKELINKGIYIGKNYGAEKFFLGVRNEKILNILKSIGYKESYLALKMILKDKNINEETLNLIALVEENKSEYLKVFNHSFSDMPHGTYLNNNRLEENLNDKNKGNYYFMVSYNDKIIGFMNCSIENEEGMFDIGLCKEFRTLGYGKLLLETAIKFLKEKEVKKISLIVIEKNKIAYNMYIKRGFIYDSIISHWIEL